MLKQMVVDLNHLIQWNLKPENSLSEILENRRRFIAPAREAVSTNNN